MESYFCHCFLPFSPSFFLRKIKQMTTLLTWDWFIQWHASFWKLMLVFLKGREHYHSFRLLFVLLYFLASSFHLSPSLCLACCNFWKGRMAGIILRGCHKGAFTVSFSDLRSWVPTPSNWLLRQSASSLYSIWPSTNYIWRSSNSHKSLL